MEVLTDISNILYWSLYFLCKSSLSHTLSLSHTHKVHDSSNNLLKPPATKVTDKFRQKPVGHVSRPSLKPNLVLGKFEL